MLPSMLSMLGLIKTTFALRITGRWIEAVEVANYLNNMKQNNEKN